MIALTVVMMMRVVGLILVIALLTMPAALCALFMKDMRKTMAMAVVLGMVFTTAGLWLSYRFDLTAGAAIILVGAAAYLLALAVARIEFVTGR
jgi:zinc transport system permease protein